MKVQKMKSERDKYKKEVEYLKRRRKILSFDLVKLKNSDLAPEAKLLHDRREPPIDSGQRAFLAMIARHPKVQKIIWSENVTSKQPSRISHICEDGELTVLYVGANNYAAKIKLFPVECPGFVHNGPASICSRLSIPGMPSEIKNVRRATRLTATIQHWQQDCGKLR